MIPKQLVFALTTALLVATAAPALSQDVVVEEETTVAKEETAAGSPYAGREVYVMVGGVYAIENNDSFPGDLSDSGGYDLRLGYSLRDWVAIEGEWQSMVNFGRDTVDPVTLNPDPTLEARMLSLNGRFLPLHGRIQPYGLFGMGWYNVQADRTSVSTHESSFAMRFGLGVAAFFTENIGINLEAGYILPLTGTLGGGHRFDVIPITTSLFFRFK